MIGDNYLKEFENLMIKDMKMSFEDSGKIFVKIMDFQNYVINETKKELMLEISNMDSKQLFKFLNKCNFIWNKKSNEYGIK